MPGDIVRETSKGTNNLLRLGAHVYTSIDDILEVLNIEHINQRKRSTPIVEPANATERRILELIGDETMHVDEIISQSTIDAQEIGSTLTIMEMKGMVLHCGGMRYCKR